MALRIGIRRQRAIVAAETVDVRIGGKEGTD